MFSFKKFLPKLNTLQWITIGIILTTLLVGFLLMKVLPGMPVVSDSVDYHSIAKSILENHSYFVIPDGLLIYPPLYPIFVAIIYSITHIGAYTAVYFAQYLIVGIISVITFFILKKHFEIRTWIAVLGATLILFWPYFLLYSQIISSEIFYIVLLVGFFGALLRQRVLLAGILLGLAILTRPVALLLVPWIIIGGYILRGNLPFKKYALVFLIALATLIPWETYVIVKYHRVIPVASNLGAVFNKANKTLSYLSPTAQAQERTPATLVKAKLMNIYLFWNPGAGGYHLDIIKEKYSTLRGGILLYKAGFFALLALAFTSVLWYHKRTNVLLAALLIGYFWALHTVLFPFPRYMMPVVPFVIILALVSIEGLLTRYGIPFKNSHLHTGEK